MDEKALFDGGILRRRILTYSEPGRETPRSVELVVGRHGGYFMARPISVESGEDWYEFRDGTRYPVHYEHHESPERAEQIAVEDIRRRLAQSGAKLIDA